MSTSGDTAEMVVNMAVKEGLEVTSEALKLTGTAVKNVAALLLAIAKDQYKVVGKASAKRLAKDPSPAVVTPLKKEDIPKFKKLAKQYGVLYFFAKPKGVERDTIDVVSTETYAANLNALYQAMGYPIPEKPKEEPPKKAGPRVRQEPSSRERGSGLKQQTRTSDRPSVRGRLAAIQARQKAEGKMPVKQKERIR